MERLISEFLKSLDTEILAELLDHQQRLTTLITNEYRKRLPLVEVTNEQQRDNGFTIE